MSKKASTKNTGVPYEKAVARIQQLLDPNTVVTHNEFLEDRLGNRRQFDVVIRGSFAGQPILGVAECKDHADKKGPAEVEAFSKKSENLGANLRIMFSKMGFTKQALKLAKHEHITCLSLLPNDLNQGGFEFGVMVYAQVWRWDSMNIKVIWPNALPAVPEFGVFELLYSGKSIAAWFLKQLATTYQNHFKTEPLELSLMFDKTITVEIRGQSCTISGVAFRATRICTCKGKEFRLLGDGVYDWLNNTVNIPTGGQIGTETFQFGFHDWEEVEGSLPENPPGPLAFAILCHVEQFDPNEEVVDLMAL